MAARETIWVFGDQLNRNIGPLADRQPSECRVLLVESAGKIASKRWHRQRAHLVIGSMRRFAAELVAAGFEVDLRQAPSLAAGLRAHVTEFAPSSITVMEPASFDGQRLVERLRVDASERGGAPITIVANGQFLCHPSEFAQWASDKKSFKMEDFYRWQRRRLGLLMDPDPTDPTKPTQPAGGQWNFDADNREPPPRDGRAWPTPLTDPLDQLDADVLEMLGDGCWGAPPDGTWATTRAGALRRLDYAIEVILPKFGPHEDAMLTTSWHLAHTLLSPYMNLGLLHPLEVCRAAEAAYRRGDVPIASAEGFIRQVIGWREYVWGVYWLWMPEYRHRNALEAHRPLPPVFTGRATTRMRCVEHVLGDLYAHGYTHHIQRLMIISNLCLTAGVDPAEVVDWMWAGFVDGAEWVMLPNVIGMGLHADGGLMATKPYASGGAYIDKMSDYCKGCAYDRKQRVGPNACPFTTLYWDFLARHAEAFGRNPRIVQQVRSAQRLSDLDAVRARAVEVLAMLDAGTL
jgi:deoxyribodipyrimidine photolyase-related protein